jgi:predicted nucleic acid-binding protein
MPMPDRVFLDASVLVRYFADDDPARAFAAAALIDSQATLVVSTTSILEVVHVMRGKGSTNPDLGEALIRFLSRDNVDLVDADRGATISAIGWSLRVSARRIADALVAAAAEHARCDWIATFDERMASPSVPVRTI